MVGTISTGWRVVRGVAALQQTIFVVGRRTDCVKGYSAGYPYKHRLDIRIRGMQWPRDMVSCEASCRLFVVDNHPQNSCIWQIDMTSGVPVTARWITMDYEPWKLSGTSSRLVVTPWRGEALYVYGGRGELLQTVPMAPFSAARHGVETSLGTFIVGHFDGPEAEEQHDRVSEFQVDGHVTRALGHRRGSGPNQLSDPYHLALDARDRVLVADYNNQRVLLLNRQLQFAVVLLRKRPQVLEGEPRRLCYVRRDSQLLVAMTGGNVNIYQWR